jgi:succinate dehydrogenase/fumarate reductase flavoprotein subunit
MKRVLAGLLGVLMLFSFSACAPAEPANTNEPAASDPSPANPAAAQSITFADTIAWDGEYDVVVVGFGAAGATTSITAADERASVLLLEKAPKGFEGGNSKVCGQYLLSFSDFDEGLTYMKALRGAFVTTDDETLAWLVAGLMETEQWVKDMGAKSVFVGQTAEYPEMPGKESVLQLLVESESLYDNFNSRFWQLLARNVDERTDKIDVWYESPGKHLIQDPISKTILGVQVERDGKMLNIRANNGVVLACGGFENNPEMQMNFLQRYRVYPNGTVYNTGDGITMALEVGADLWHMSTVSGPFLSYKGFENSDQVPFENMAQNITSGKSVINVGPDGKRFTDEGTRSRHGHISYNGVFRQQLAVTPMYTIFDQATLEAGPIFKTFSEDNSAEIEKGLIVKADSIAELAEKIGYDPAVLTATVEEYNKAVKSGNDLLFNRPADTMEPIERGPYYAIELVPSMVNTQGGPKRNTNCEVLNPQGAPIPQLYSAGELGSFYPDQYNGGGNLNECVVTGRTAGANAAAPKGALPEINLHQVDSNIVYTLGSHEDDGNEIALGANEYLGEGTGMGGTLIVKVKMNGNLIDSIEVVSHSETPGIGDQAIDKLPAMIIDAQSVEVDSISGATLTSNAIKAAVTDAIAKSK